ncbi:hypothetical protein J3R30DRAFT_3458300 [Lentinula aciculospora]|uniref:Uncharacterized protein n=1 Tax=Lentinula aciculospora TaxID=153920 RepID=A0A9W9AGX1_9AGAR|nr:hypothetical protein J3R30DRAFT_3458300 [Lentinula aciculospora]
MIFPSFAPTSLLFLALAHLALVVYSSPINPVLLYEREVEISNLDHGSNTTHELYPRIDFDKPNLILGYLAVPKSTAEEFNAHGFTAIPVNRLTKPLGSDGTYVEATAIPDHLLPNSYWKCAVFINTLEMVQTLRGYVDDVKNPAYNKPGYLRFFIEDLEKEWKKIGKHFVPGPPLLAARTQKGWTQLLILVPHQYLLKSPSKPNQPSGDNHLKLSVKCTPRGTALHIDLPPPEWEYWGFEYWPKGLTS